MSEYCIRRLFIFIDIDPERGASNLPLPCGLSGSMLVGWELLRFVVGDETYFGFKIMAISMDYPPLNPWFKWCPTCLNISVIF